MAEYLKDFFKMQKPIYKLDSAWHRCPNGHPCKSSFISAYYINTSIDSSDSASSCPECSSPLGVPRADVRPSEDPFAAFDDIRKELSAKAAADSKKK